MKKAIFIAILISGILFLSNGFAADATGKPLIYNTTLTLADTEYSQTISPNVNKIMIQARTGVDVRLAYVTGKVATPTAPYITIKAGSVYWIDNLNNRNKPITLYFASSTAGTVMETEVWK